MTNPINTVIIDSEPQSLEIEKLYLEEISDINITGQFRNIEEGYNFVLEKMPDVLIVDISSKSDLSLDIISKISMNKSDCKILVTSSDMSADVVIKAMRAGAREFISKPLIKEDFISAVTKLKNLTVNNNVNKKCRIISTFSNKGGIGKTSVAVNLALELANITKEKVALIDLNLQLGDITTFLDLNPGFDISYVIKNLSKIDETFLLSTFAKYKDTSMYVLADPPYLEQGEEITAEQISSLLDKLKQTFSYIVIDTSANIDSKTVTALDQSDIILLIAIVNLPAIRNCQRCLELFANLGYEPEKTKIVLNRYMENEEIKIEDVEEVLDKKVYWKIPNNYFTIISAINKGIPVSGINSESNIAQSYKELAAKLSDNIYKQDYSQKIARKSDFNFMNLFK